MRWNTFGRSAVFAALAGGGILPWLLIVGPLVGVRAAVSLYLVAVAALYVTAIAPTLRRRLGVGILVGVPGAAFAPLLGLPALAITLGLLLALARSGFLYCARPARALAVEAALVAGGLLFAGFLAGTSLSSLTLAIWGFLLVQSLFFLVGGVRTREPGVAYKDPFDAAYERANAVLDGLSV